jgi:prolyl-tRNA editing enzyme YbaK/EbsC (Cys-tRNA(Pro) deacylase)
MLEELPALDHPDLMAPAVFTALSSWPLADQVTVVRIDPEYADTAAMSERYDVPMADGANCVVVVGRRDGAERIAACLVRADMRADVNGVVKRHLDVRKASFLAHERAVEETAMEYGGITPIGLPSDWRLLVDEAVTGIDRAIIGSGVRGSKLYVPGPALGRLPGAEVLALAG